MPSVTVPPVEEAARLFRRLGYTVDDGGREFDARRKWRTVRVTVLAPDEAEGASALADGGCPCDGAELRCYVTRRGHTDELEARLEALDPDCEWAILGVESEKQYEVVGT